MPKRQGKDREIGDAEGGLTAGQLTRGIYEIIDATYGFFSIRRKSGRALALIFRYAY